MPHERRSHDDRQMLELLKQVSRSFYLSVRLLPRELRRPVAVGYLLARTSDSIADAPGLQAADRLAMLQQFDDDVQGRCPPSPIPAPREMPEAEARLLGAFENCMAWLNALDAEDRRDVLGVLEPITHGQRLDVRRFGEGQPTRLTAEELDEYTYLVAGCAGEFWTRLGFRHLPNFASLPMPQMLELGRRYGMGLQLINVLRDARDDEKQGRNYLPGPQAGPWIAKAREGLECGMKYALALRPARVRAASALPALIGFRTLAAMPAKVPRSDVKWLLARLALSFGSRGRLQREFDIALGDNRPR